MNERANRVAETGTAMKLLFVMPHPGYVRNYESTIRDLAARGHRIHLGFENPNRARNELILDRLVVELSGVTYDRVPERPDGWAVVAKANRLAMDYVRYMDPRFRDARALRRRVEERLRGPLRLLRRINTLPWPIARAWIRAMMGIEEAIPSSGLIDAYLMRHRPDAVVVTPLVDVGSKQVEFLKSAAAHGIPSALAVASWDNLTNKGLIRVRPDRVFVWNYQQRDEAIDLHLIPADRMRITGAPRFDEWFDRQPSVDRETFCRRLGLSVDRPIVLYVCSSPFIAPGRTEPAFVERWIEAIRHADDRNLRAASVIVRPHPQNAAAWGGVDLHRHGAAVIWPAGGENPTHERAKAAFFDSLSFSGAVVGVNTSALIEAGIVGRPVYTIEVADFAEAHAGTLHYRHLHEPGGGLVHSAANLNEHLAQLAAGLRGEDDGEARGRRFAGAFVRPFGLDVSATGRLADEIEALAGVRVRRGRSRSARVIRTALWPAAIVARMLGLHRSPSGSLAWRVARSPVRVPRRLYRTVRRPARRVAKIGVKRSRTLRRLLRAEAVTSGAAPARRVRALAVAEEDAAKRVGRAVRAALATDSRLLVGPWTSEVGFEVLYWIPFLSWLIDRYAIDRERLVIYSRGGTATWYQHIARNYVDVFDFISAEEFLVRNRREWETRGGQKQTTVSTLDADLIRAATRTLDIDERAVLHPSLMYGLFTQFWREQQPMRFIEKHSRFLPWTAPPGASLPDCLPREYIAARFYFSPSFPDTPANRRFVDETVHRLAASTPVVLLSSGMSVDDHAEVPVRPHGNIHRIDALISPRTNLDVQTRVIAGASSFVGTYGGIAYLAPHFGVTSIGIYSDAREFLPSHLEVASRAFHRGAFGQLATLSVEQARLLVGLLGVEAADSSDRAGTIEAALPTSRVMPATSDVTAGDLDAG